MVGKRVAVMFEQFGWMHIVALLRGAGLTLGICVASTILGCILGVFLGMGELSSNKIVRGLCKAYVNLVRGIPLLIIPVSYTHLGSTKDGWEWYITTMIRNRIRYRKSSSCLHLNPMIW